MRNSLLLLGGAVALVGVGLVARPREGAPEVRGIVVVRGAARVEPIAHAAAAPIEAGVPIAGSPAVVADADEGFGDPGIWATPAEFDQPERLD